MGISIDLLPEAKAGWPALAGAESRAFRADLAGRPRLREFTFHIEAPTKAQEIKAASTPWGFPISHAPGERIPWLEGVKNYRAFRMVADPNAVVLHKH